jgi:O-antigen ligase
MGGSLVSSEMQSRIPRSLLRYGGARWHHVGAPVGLISILLLVYGVGVVALFTTGRVGLVLAITLLVVPVAAALAVVRPEWILLVVVLLPPSVMGQVPPTQMTAVLLLTLFGFLLQGRLHLGLRTGIYPLVGIIAMAIAMKADTPADATAAADDMLRYLVYYTLLMLAAFQATANERIRVDSFVDALILGAVVTAILQPFLHADATFESIARTPFQGQFAYIAAMAFGVSYVRYSLATGGSRRGLDRLLSVVFLGATVLGWARTMWVAALFIFALVSRWTGKKSFWIASSLVLVLAMTVPLVGERILPIGTADITDAETIDRITTGRSVLWGDLWERGAEAFPWGNGWGYMWSLTPGDIFGFEGEFTTGDNPFVYPHNDFLFVFLELGIVGVGLLVAFWLRLVRGIRTVSRARDESVRFGVRVLVPVLVVGFLVQLFDNSLAIRPVAERVFVTAGLVLGLVFHWQRSEDGSLVVEKGLVSSLDIDPRKML